jgi:hypothetical protein
MRARTQSGPQLAGIARLTRPTVAKSAAVFSIAGAVLALSGCAPQEDGVVLEGADGQNYVVPDDAERPMYDSKEDCIADVTAQIQQLQAQGETITDSPEDLCEDSSRYPAAHYAHPWLGPILFAGTRWSSPAVAGWSPVQSGNFAASGSTLQSDVVSPAPAGSKVGDRAPLKGGFGSSGKGGFASGKSGSTGG